MSGREAISILEKLLIQASATVQDAMAAIAAYSRGVVLRVDEQQRFLRTITDGALRRASLAGHAVGTVLSVAVDIRKRKSTTAPVG
ncbi:MAG: hypothetical protein ACK5MO_16945, partial [Planctomyces sp.]